MSKHENKSTGDGQGNFDPSRTKNDGATGGEGDYTSSASMLSVMLAMLNELDVRGGQKVLEVGTGTGWRCDRHPVGSPDGQLPPAAP